jgi:hypothetical protein
MAIRIERELGLGHMVTALVVCEEALGARRRPAHWPM